MDGELDPFDYTLAETLHMTVAEMRHRLSNPEYIEWRAFYAWRAAMREKELEKAKRGRR